MTTTAALSALLDYATDAHLIVPEDRPYFMNRLLEVMQLAAPEEEDQVGHDVPPTATPLLEILLSQAAERGLFPDSLEQRDLFAAKVMGVLTPSPAEIRSRFQAIKQEKGIRAAIDDFYALCQKCDYIKTDRIAKNVRFFHDTPYGEMEITINLSKPEKDPRDIAAALQQKSADYPKCMLCVENPGYAGRVGFPARQNHRMLPLTLCGETYYLQYSPYAYYPEHVIIFNEKHIPMTVSRASMGKLLDFVDQIPHYMVGSNADLPIVGGSILTHDHFQGGGYTFPMEKAGVRMTFTSPHPAVRSHLAAWPMTCIVLESEEKQAVLDAATNLLSAWRIYSDPDCDILAETTAPHNTVTPVVRKIGETYRMYLVLRNNRTTPEHPMGLFHPWEDKHAIKKENIGLIEVMGLFILPGRLKTELAAMEEYLTDAGKNVDHIPEDSPLKKHQPWLKKIVEAHGQHLTATEAQECLRAALSDTCAQVLSDAGVYKQTPAGDEGVARFMKTLGYTRKA